MESQIDFLYKITLIGESGVGKTNLISRFSKNEFSLESRATIGVEFSTKTVEFSQKQVKLQIWDTAGQERFRAVSAQFYKGSLGALIVYDITKRATFESVRSWLSELRQFTGSDPVILLVGNKSDLRHLRAVTQQEARDLAQQLDLYFMETSAMDNSNVTEAFMRLAQEIMAKHGANLGVYQQRSIGGGGAHGNTQTVQLERGGGGGQHTQKNRAKICCSGAFS